MADLSFGKKGTLTLVYELDGKRIEIKKRINSISTWDVIISEAVDLCSAAGYSMTESALDKTLGEIQEEAYRQ